MNYLDFVSLVRHNAAMEAANQSQQRIQWYRTPVEKELLSKLTARSDLRGLLQTGAFLGLLIVTGCSAFYAWGHLPVPVFILLLLLHGTCYNFLLNGFHELCHNTVFRTKILNRLFVHVFSFLSVGNNVYLFTASHTQHHLYTLHPPRDLEVVLPVRYTLWSFMKSAIVNPSGLFYALRSTIRLCLGRLDGDWEHRLFPESDPASRRRLFLWARITLVGHAALAVASVASGLWLLPVLITLAPFYGGWLLFLCNNTQHVGLKDNVADFRLCCRTFLVNPVIGFLYWHMNYHIEHHMYAAVPCYNLKRLHHVIQGDLPECPIGLFRTWKGIIAILARQRKELTYQYAATLPAPIPK